MKYTVHNTIVNTLSSTDNFSGREVLWLSRIQTSGPFSTNRDFLTNVNSWGTYWTMNDPTQAHWEANKNLDVPLHKSFTSFSGIGFKLSPHQHNHEQYKNYLNDLQISTNSRRDDSSKIEIIQYINQKTFDSYNLIDMFNFDEIMEDPSGFHYTNSKKQLVDNFDFADITDIYDSLTQESKGRFDTSLFGTSDFIVTLPDALSTIVNSCFDNSTSNEKFKMYDIKKLCRGSGGPEMELKPKSFKAFSKGYKIIPVKICFPILDIKTEETNTGYVYFFLTNFNLSLIRKYRKASAFIRLLQNYTKCNEGSWFYDKELFEKLEEKKFGKNVVYWDKLSKIFKNSSMEYNKIVPHSQVKETEFDPKFYSIYSKIKKTKDNNHYSAYIKNSTRLNEITSKITSLENSKQTISRRKQRVEQAIENAKRELSRYSEDLKGIEREKQEIEVNLPSYHEIKKTLTPKIKTLKENYKKYLEEFSQSIIEDTTEDKYRSNFEKKGIVIDCVKYRNTDTNEIFSLKDSKTLLSSIDPDSNLKIHSLEFRITKPVIIYVDRMEKGENCKKVVGGPYIITVTESNLEIGLLSSASVFGYNEGNRSTIYVHPHSGTMGADTSSPERFWNQVLNVKSRACLGEASQAVHAAFKAKDIRQIILACMTWVTSANSSDTWGRNFKYFPKPEAVKESRTKINITKDYINSQTFEDQIKESEGVLDLLYDALPEESIETQTNSQLEQEVQIPVEIQESMERLRRAGNPNYQPLYRSSNET